MHQPPIIRPSQTHAWSLPATGLRHRSVQEESIMNTMSELKTAYHAARAESQCIHLPIAQRVAAGDRADAIRIAWRELRDARDAGR